MPCGLETYHTNDMGHIFKFSGIYFFVVALLSLEYNINFMVSLYIFYILVLFPFHIVFIFFNYVVIFS